VPLPLVAGAIVAETNPCRVLALVVVLETRGGVVWTRQSNEAKRSRLFDEFVLRVRQGAPCRAWDAAQKRRELTVGCLPER
jgi:hypothetical protein